MTVTRRFTAAGLALLGTAVAVYAYGESRPRHASDTGLALDPDVVAVLPFSVQGSQPALSDLRDAIEDLVAARFPGGDGTPRALDQGVVRSALRRVVPAEKADVSVEGSRRIAAELGAGQLLRGEVKGTPDDLTIEVELVAVPGGAVRAWAVARGDADSLTHLADGLVARLLAVQAARDSEELAALQATSLPALRAYLTGVHAYRRGHCCTPSEAADHFARAWFLDSTFAVAGLRLAELGWWGMAELEGRWKLDAIWNQRDRLGAADRALLAAYLGPRYPRSSTLAERIAAAERAALAAPNRVEAWRIAGRTLFLFGSVIGHPEWETRAIERLRRGLALDSTDETTLVLLLRLAARADDGAAVRRYARLYVTYNPTAYQREAIRWLTAVVLDDSVELLAVRTRLENMHRFDLRALVEWSPTIGLGLTDADRAARLYDARSGPVEDRRAVIVGVVPYFLNRGRPGAASRLLATAERGFGQRADVGVLEFRIHAALYWEGDSNEAAAAAESLEAYLNGAAVRLGHVRGPGTARCALAHWRLAAGDLAGAEAVLGRMPRPVPTAGSDTIESLPVCVAAAAAQLAAARGRPDAGAALARLDALLAAGSDARHLLPAVGNLVAARLHERRGDMGRALALMRRRTIWGNQLLSTQVREEGRLAALVGDTTGAIRAYRHYLVLRDDPEPRLRPEVERVRAELQRLGRVSLAP